MVEFSLPANSTVGSGKSFAAADGATNTKTFNIYRYDPDTSHLASPGGESLGGTT